MFCKSCGKWFCTTHRIPEIHDCSGLKEKSVIIDDER